MKMEMKKSRFRRTLSLIVLIALLFSLVPQANVMAAPAIASSSELVASELKVDGNKIVDSSGTTVRLTGVNVDSLEWTKDGENVVASTQEAFNNWGVNVIRLTLNQDFWFGAAGPDATALEDDVVAYRKVVDRVIVQAAKRGKYVILDLHWSEKGGWGKSVGQQMMPNDNAIKFWQSVSSIYGNDPTVLFGLFNEPHDVSWEVWKNGGSVTDSSEANYEVTYHTPGFQALVKAVRDTGAKNICIVGGLDWGYDLTGVMDNYAIADTNTEGDFSGNGIVYDAHVYPWKKDRDEKVAIAKDVYPILIGECGWDESHGTVAKNEIEDYATWVPSLLDWLDDNQFSWTAWSLHPSTSPVLIDDWDYTPSEHWGVYVKPRLLSYQVGAPAPAPVPPAPANNIALFKPVVAKSQLGSNIPSHAVDGDSTTRWESDWYDDQWMYVDLGASQSFDNVRIKWENSFAKAYKIQVSDNADTWTDVYSTIYGDGGISDIRFPKQDARYVRMLGITRGTQWGFSIYEFGVYDTSAPAPAPYSIEGLQNPGFEDQTSDWYGNGAKVERDSTVMHSGAFSLKTTERQGEWAGPTQDVTAQLQRYGQGDYDLKASVRMATAATTGRITVKIETSNGQEYIGTDFKNLDSTDFSTISQRVKLSWTGNLTKATFYVETKGTDDFYIDDSSMARYVDQAALEPEPTPTLTPEESIPDQWSSADIGNPAVAGGVIYHAGGTFEIAGAGSNADQTKDMLHYVYQTLNGDGVIVARVNYLQNISDWAKAGVMIRENLDGGSKNVLMGITKDHGASMTDRSVTNGSSQDAGLNGADVVPAWVKLERAGSTFKGYSSPDGTNWTLIGTVDVNMASSVYVGLAVNGNNDSKLCTAYIDSVKVTGGIVEPPQPQFLKGINFGGGDVLIEGNQWLSMDKALQAGLSFDTPYNAYTSDFNPKPTPSDAETNAMLNSCIWSNDTISFKQTIPNGEYKVYFWAMEVYQSNFRAFDVTLEDRQVTSKISSLKKGYWEKYGPYNVTVSDGTMNIVLVDQIGDPGVMGMAIYKKVNASPANSAISPDTAHFYSNAAHQADVPVTIAFNGHPLAAIMNGTHVLREDVDYTLSSNTVTIKKAYLAGQTDGTVNLTFKFCAGADQTLKITVSDSPVSTPTPTPTPTPDGTPTPTPDATPIPMPDATPTPVPAMTIVGDTVISTVDKNKLINDLNAAMPDALGIKTVKLTVNPVSGARAYVQQLPTDFFATAVGKNEVSSKVEIDTAWGTVVLPNNMFIGKAISGADQVGISMAQADSAKLGKETKERIGDRPIIELSATVDGQPVAWMNNNASVTISVPYSPSAQELNNPEHIVVWHVDENGKITSIPNGKYDPAAGKITFSTTHFGTYAVAYVDKQFSDLDKYTWAKKQAEVLAAKGITNGTSETTFSPGKNIGRADFIVLLVKALGLNADVESNFTDVKQGDYYYEALGIAKKLGIASGINDNRFNPKAAITRQDALLLLAKAMQAAGKTVGSGDISNLNAFADKSNVAPYAISEIAALVNEGIVKGDGKKLNPLSNLTRAEAAVILYNAYEN